ncbi:unnamed protein product, partial [Hapterophycus canaliculatus]
SDEVTRHSSYKVIARSRIDESPNPTTSGLSSQVTQLILHRDEAGESKRFAFVTFADKESTNACLEKLDGLEVAGKALAV